MQRTDGAQLFVGRRRELAELDSALEQSMAGRGQVVALVGEAGIGKTRTAQEFARLATARGARVLWGKCFEEPGAPPYWPWLQVLRDYVRSTDEAVLERIADFATASIAELVPELARRLPKLEIPPPLEDAAQARYRLFDAITLHWTRAAAEQPLVIVLDNLHWADAASLRLLEFLAPEVGAGKLLLLGTYRDLEVTRTHPLSATLSEFARLTHYRRIALTGLLPEDTACYLSNVLDEEVDAEAIADIHGRTEGLPLYLVEVVRYLMQIRSARGGAPGDRWRVPEGIRAIIGGRLNRLSSCCVDYLRHAAVIGRHFNARVMDVVLAQSNAGENNGLLEEALSARIIEALPEKECYQFVHALLRETLYDEIPVPRRAGLHRRMGEAMEIVFAGDLESHLSVLVQHYQSALPEADAAHLADLALRAASQADALFAHEEAARYCTVVLSAWVASGHSDVEAHCQLLLRLARSLDRGGDGMQALRIVRRAFDLASKAKLQTMLGESIVFYEYVAHRLSLPGSSAVSMVQEALPHLRGIDDALRARVLSAWMRSLVFLGRSEEAHRIAEESVSVARKANDALVLGNTLIATLFGIFLRGEYFNLRQERTEEACALAERTGNKILLLDGYEWRMGNSLECGDTGSLSQAHREFMRVSAAVRMPLRTYMGACVGATMALMEGRFAEYEALVRKAFELGRRLPDWDASSGFSVQMFNLFHTQGRLAELAPVFQGFMQERAGARPWLPGVMMMHMALDQRESARVVFDRLMAQVMELPRDGTWATSIVYLAEVCVYLGDAVRAQTLYDQLSPFDGRNIVTGFYLTCHGPAGRLLGMLGTLLGRWEMAEKHFASALELASLQGARPSYACIEYEYACMLQARGTQSDAQAALQRAESATRLAHELGMPGLRRRADRLRVQLGEQSPSQNFPAGLSRREVQVLRLIAQGQSNQEIADALVRSPNTVANHVRSILAKVNAANRAEAAIFAARHGLLV